ncbi:MAG TPA: hypothetical protein VFU37_11190 [Pyrinomonadaceae bacterium]|nr:hypothetical protein [Pyrinomonadaceae bacterium]
MAHAIFEDEAKKRSQPIRVYSAGVFDFSHEPQIEETTMTCLKHNTSPPAQSPTWVGQLPLGSIDRFLVMEKYHADILTREYGVSPDRVSLLGGFDPRQRGVEIADPFGQGKVAYERSYQLIRDCIIQYFDLTHAQSIP